MLSEVTAVEEPLRRTVVTACADLGANMEVSICQLPFWW